MTVLDKRWQLKFQSNEKNIHTRKKYAQIDNCLIN